MLSENFERTIDIWIDTLNLFDFTQICKKPSAASWSLGQVVMHLLHEADWYLDQVRTCLKTNDNGHAMKTAIAMEMFRSNSFPDEVIEGPASNQFVQQPESKDDLVRRLGLLKTSVVELSRAVSGTTQVGKTKHPGLGYLDAKEWLQFSDMHFRHHLRQRDRILVFLAGNR
jgi:hypothetical protein